MKLLTLALLLLSTTTYAQSVRPGLWKAESSFTINGIELPDSKGEDCISSKDAKDIKAAIMKKIEKKGCKATKWSAKGQNIQVSLTCKKSGLDAKGDLRGTITDTKYDLKGEAEGEFHKLPSQAVISLQGNWVKACK
ncbi:MAG: DUF3617 family protein [Bdellovibrionota bacterium]